MEGCGGRLVWEWYCGLQHARAGRIFHTVVDSLSRSSDADAAVVVDDVADRIAVVAADSRAAVAVELPLKPEPGCVFPPSHNPVWNLNSAKRRMCLPPGQTQPKRGPEPGFVFPPGQTPVWNLT